MKKYQKTLAAFLLFTSLTGCGFAEGAAPPTQPINQTAAKQPSQEVQASLDTLKGYLAKINDTSVAPGDREGVQAQFIEGLGKLVSMKESLLVNDNDLAIALDNQITVKTKAVNLNGADAKLRWVSYNGLPEINGTLERVWSFVQWGDDQKTNSQLLLEQGAELVQDFFLTKIGGKDHLIALGHLTENTPSSVFAVAWVLNQNKWEPANVFAENNPLPQVWNAQLYENELMINHTGNATVNITPTEQNDGFVLTTDEAPDQKVTFKLEGEKFQLQK
ncbi:hypothetical protein [Brevibacillus migulae]|uniref:hypothetical protein n=1 Tax=Brevibacillus migulae TaxID=1644114 RepID=UPI00106DE1B1|nr:hypothetical protein [Brevibacillus migulae]